LFELFRIFLLLICEKYFFLRKIFEKYFKLVHKSKTMFEEEIEKKEKKKGIEKGEKIENKEDNFDLNDYEETVAYYDGISEGYDELHFKEQVEKFKILKEHMLIPDESKVLDVGCGTFFSKDFFCWDMWGIEPSSKMVELFIEKAQSQRQRIKVGFAEELVKDYGEEVFDAVICVSVAHHFKRPKIVFEEMSKVSKPFAKIGITLLRNTKNFVQLQSEIKDFFDVLEVIDSSKDLIFICMKKQ
jgi:ubiquinone/menaquinone biosynthesis C-methylase UbiE